MMVSWTEVLVWMWVRVRGRGGQCQTAPRFPCRYLRKGASKELGLGSGGGYDGSRRRSFAHLETTMRYQVCSSISPSGALKRGVAQRHQFGGHLHGGDIGACDVAETVPGEPVGRGGKRIQTNFNHLFYQWNLDSSVTALWVTDRDREVFGDLKYITSGYKGSCIVWQRKHHFFFNGGPVTGAPIPSV